MENSFDFLSWVMEQSGDDYTLERKDEDHIRLDADTVYGEINRYHFEMEVAELRLNRKSDDETIFFLHFELKDAEHAEELFEEMIGILRKQNERRTTRILLSCTSAMTTSFFAGKLSEGAKTLSLDYEFAAIPFPSLYEKAFDYDVILMAPQIAYEYEKVRQILYDKIVLQIPPALFATYDTGSVLEYVRDEIAKAKTTKEEIAVAKVMRDIENNAKIFAITVTHDLDRTFYGYRIYNSGEITFSEKVIKRHCTERDIYDIMDTQFQSCCKESDIDCVAISMPGVVYSYREKKHIRFEYSQLAAKLSESYHIPVFVSNNTTAVAIGFYAGQDKYDTITYHSHPRGGLVGGEGFVIDGHPVIGSHQMSGELGPIFRRERPGVGVGNVISHSPERVLEMLSLYLTANIAMIDPQVILVRCDLVPDMDELRRKIAEVMEEQYIPDLISVRDVSEYAFLGTMLFGLHEFKDYVVEHEVRQHQG